MPEELKRYIFLYLSTNEVIYLEKVPTYGDLVEFTPESQCSRAWPERGVLRCFEHDQERLTSRRWEQFHHAAGRLCHKGYLEHRNYIRDIRSAAQAQGLQKQCTNVSQVANEVFL
ncbi:hypothetical protein FOCG_06380 [Fusarium oxysporum f. sp. radicis-lycopersici 26381]|uniref:Uncharacterized protein n=1 Tax=Fusarium oxysporum Fo47 TaxID=660027 RepID=W9KXM9_FUSOX|nr:hypothetical protein FOZG_03440 [Fusarium oxysporum Fo47]EWZ92582.1 hypothetical protein FOWG_05677 [Fusarium oxysporum f. sp. lycopersici MN25]EXL52866.1 hypothetical protein FOCG_06380 [Fusarium oxysporum f. sp. radicis-lycopersici 26381]RKK59283.1 hypothetical protein BFJ66_g2286 [Fusarium oxysporum f. sp. cepae]